VLCQAAFCLMADITVLYASHIWQRKFKSC